MRENNIEKIVVGQENSQSIPGQIASNFENPLDTLVARLQTITSLPVTGFFREIELLQADLEQALADRRISQEHFQILLAEIVQCHTVFTLASAKNVKDYTTRPVIKFNPVTNPTLQQTIPAELKTLRQWVTWRYDWDAKSERWGKRLYNPANGYPAKSTDPTTWGAFETALSAATQYHHDGIGFVFSESDPYVGIDIDKVCFEIDGQDDVIAFGQAILDRFPDIYVELSPSGTGLHLIGIAEWGRGCNSQELGLEVYDRGRYFCFTGAAWGEPKSIRELATGEIEYLRAQFKNQGTAQTEPSVSVPAPTTLCGCGTLATFPADAKIGDQRLCGSCQKYVRLTAPSSLPATQEFKSPASTTGVSEIDNVLHLIACSAAADQILPLYRGDMSSCENDHSKADFLFCFRIAFWCKNKPGLMDQIFRTSALYRPKWDERHYSDGKTYGQKIVEEVLNKCQNFQTEYITIDFGLSKPTPQMNAWRAPETDVPPEILYLEAPTIEQEQAAARELLKDSFKWRELLAFEDHELLPTPLEIFSPWFRQMAIETAACTSVDPVMPLLDGLGACSAILGGHSWIKVKNGWKEVTNLYTLNVADSGTRKSKVKEEMFAQVYAIEAAKKDEVMALLKKEQKARKKKRSQIARERKLISQIENFDAQGKPRPAYLADVNVLNKIEWCDQEEADLDALPKLVGFKMLGDDVTSEKLYRRLEYHGQQYAVVSGECQIFVVLLGLYTQKENVNVLLKGKTRERLDKDRVSDDKKNSDPDEIIENPIVLNHPCLTVSLAVQPLTLTDMLKKHGSLVYQGTLARFLMAFSDPIKPPEDGTPEISLATAQRYNSCLARFFNGRHELPENFYLTQTSRRLCEKLTRTIFEQVYETERLKPIKEWSQRIPGMVVQVGFWLHVLNHLETDLSLNEISDVIPDKCIDGGLEFLRCLSTHTQKIFHLFETAPAQRAPISDEDAEKLAKRLETLLRQGKLEQEPSTGYYYTTDRQLQWESKPYKKRLPKERALIIDLLVDSGHLQRINLVTAGHADRPVFVLSHEWTERTLLKSAVLAV